MTYVQGFITPVPMANRQAYLDHTAKALPLLKEFGANRLVEAWGDDVPTGKLNDFHGAVQRKEDEAVLFSWIEYSDRATYDAAVEKMMTDPRMKMMADCPFDARRIVYGGFDMLIDEGPRGAMGYVDGILLSVPSSRKDEYVAFARPVTSMFCEYGATRCTEAWGTDVPNGELTDFYRAALATEDETIVFSWVEWPDKPTRDAGMKGMREDERMKTPPADMPFDGKRMIFGGFRPIFDR